MSIKNPMLEKVFLALRPNFFPDEPREHITLKYYNRIQWDVLLEEAARMEKLPAIIEPVHYSTWQAWGKGPWYRGLIVSNPGGTILDHLHMPHITLTQDWDSKPLIANLEPQIVDTLWIGKSVNKQLIWAKVAYKQIEVNYDTFGIPKRHQLSLDH